MIRSTFQAFETAKRALNVSQAGLDTVGHNISNAKTPGYTRQRVDQVSLSLNGVAQKYRTFGPAYTGLGSDINAISQVRDPYLDNRYRAQAAVNGELSVKNYGLTDINNIFDETTTDGLSAKLSELLDSLEKLSTQADSKEYASVVRTTASQLVQLLNQNATALEEARGTQTLELKTTVADNVNTILEKIASLNTAIKQDNFYGDPSNDLNDSRNMLIDQLSEYLDIKVVRTPVEVTKGMFVESVSIYLNDGSDPPIELVNSGNFNKLGVQVDEKSGDVKITLLDGISGLVNKTVGNKGDITSNILSGGIKGYIDIINGKGDNASVGESSFRGIPYYQAALDEFAQKLASVFNSINNISAGDIENNQSTIYNPTFEKNLFTALTPTVSSTSGVNWVKAFNTGTLGFSGNDAYKITFEQNADDPNKIDAKVTNVNGVEKVYTAEYSANGEMQFIGEDKTVAFSITNDNTSLADILASSLQVDATVTAKNISIAKNWITDPLYMTATKLDPSTVTAAFSLSVTGTQPSWIDSIAKGSVSILTDDYDFGTYNDGTDDYLTMTSSKGVTYTAKVTGLGAGDKITFKDADGNVGLNLTLSSTFDPADVSGSTLGIKNTPATATATVLSISGSAPSWIKAVSNSSSGVLVQDGSYKFEKDSSGDYLTVKIGSTTYTSNKKLSEMKAGEQISFKDEYGTTGLYVTLSSTFDSGKTGVYFDSGSTVNIKNQAAAANDNILKFKEAMYADNFYSTTGFTGSFHEFIVDFQKEMALDMSINTSLLATSDNVMASYADRRDAVSAVSIDEEGIDMMTYQNYYNAAARYMNVIDEALDKIINGMGMVGR